MALKPNRKALRKTAEEKTIEAVLLGQIEKGNDTASGIAKATVYPRTLLEQNSKN
jgi:hypothetical protein